LLRLPPMCVADVLGEWFSSPLLTAALSLPALAGTFTGPWSPGNAINLLRRESLSGPGVVGGGPMLVAALQRAAESAGVEIRTGTAVERIRMGARGVQGVTLVGGETIDATQVAASCHPRHTLLELVTPGSIEYRLEHRIDTFRTRGTVAHVLLALDKAPSLGGPDDETIQWARTGAHVDDLERAHDALKYREIPSTPILDVHLPTVEQPDLAPPGHAVASVLVHFAPHSPDGGWTDDARDALGDRVVELLGEHDAGLPGSVVGRQVLTPSDLEARYGVAGGNLHHGEHSLDQLLVRPTPECIHHRTPLPGLFLCGSGSHPGGGLTCAPGELAAAAMLAAK
ncbi:MAG: NAD(P)/FAD-dependent oxidoreductase, partial [Deltaproteobacteria bacterium]|nr:NAD(P)/FAD-dependent oxidoreductase [Deltaproteobacteria bacterium]